MADSTQDTAPFEALKVTRDGPITRIVLDRPGAAHGMNETLTRELATVAAQCDDAETKVVTLTATGRFFCAGGDLKAMSGSGDPSAFVKRIADQLHRALSTFARMDAVLINAVNGVAAGAGFPLAVSGDLVLAASGASFTMAYTRAGLSPDGGSTHLLPRLIGLRRTQELMLTNRTLDAAEAADWGLVTEVVPDAELPARLDELAARIAAGPRSSHAAVKRLLLGSPGTGYEEQLEHEARSIAACAAAADGREGIAAFLGKRAPSFG